MVGLAFLRSGRQYVQNMEQGERLMMIPILLTALAAISLFITSSLVKDNKSDFQRAAFVNLALFLVLNTIRCSKYHDCSCRFFISNDDNDLSEPGVQPNVESQLNDLPEPDSTTPKQQRSRVQIRLPVVGVAR